jgi:hypothetical protein
MLVVGWAAIEIMNYKINHKDVFISVEKLKAHSSTKLKATKSPNSTKF